MHSKWKAQIRWKIFFLGRITYHSNFKEDLGDLKFPVGELLTLIEQLMKMLILYQSSENI